VTIDPTTAATPASVLTPREVGTTGLRTFPIAFDGSVLGWVTGVEQAEEVLGRFSDAGGTLVSTADHYAAGRSEFMIGRWLKTVDRSSVLVATKVGRHPDRPGLGRHQIENSVDASKWAAERNRTLPARMRRSTASKASSGSAGSRSPS
jgi:aryl-alcohol dehydrogenase-like predicted oxidoreductase